MRQVSILNCQTATVIHGAHQGLRLTHATKACSDRQCIARTAGKMLAGTFTKDVISALNNAPGTDVNPRNRLHLTVHGQAPSLQVHANVPSHSSAQPD